LACDDKRAARHELDQSAALADRAYVIESGQIVVAGTAAEIAANGAKVPMARLNAPTWARRDRPHPANSIHPSAGNPRQAWVSSRYGYAYGAVV
jgi:ABC-type glutathione transport system ATPase component